MTKLADHLVLTDTKTHDAYNLNKTTHDAKRNWVYQYWLYWHTDTPQLSGLHISLRSLYISHFIHRIWILFKSKKIISLTSKILDVGVLSTFFKRPLLVSGVFGKNGDVRFIGHWSALELHVSFIRFSIGSMSLVMTSVCLVWHSSLLLLHPSLHFLCTSNRPVRRSKFDKGLF